ncbi:MAG: hypothetical protein JXA74_14700 [Anaerolineae bacterium]|nr:hypothetical protein [Anaerolineae bacterium]
MLRSAWLPLRRAMTLVVAALGLALLGLGCAVAFELTASARDDPLGVRAMGVGMFVLPVVALVLIIASFVERRAAPRALIWLLVSGAVLLAGLMLAIAMALDPDAGPTTGGVAFALFCAPAAFLPALPALFFVLKARPELQATLRAQRQERIRALLASRGMLRLPTLAAELACREEEAVALVHELLERGELQGELYREHGLLYEPTTLAGLQRRLLGLIRTRGQAQVDELAAELGVPLGLLQEWLYELVRRGRFSGYVQWDDGLLYSAEAGALRKGGVCPRCGGRLSLAGKGIMACEYCGAEIFGSEP